MKTFRKVSPFSALLLGLSLPQSAIAQNVTISNGSHEVADAIQGGANGSYAGFSLRLNDPAFIATRSGASAECRVLPQQIALTSLKVRRGSGTGGAANAYLRIYTSATPSAASLVGISANAADMSTGNAAIEYTFDNLRLDTTRTYYAFFMADNNPATHTPVNARLRASSSIYNPARHYTSGRLLNTSGANTSWGYTPLFAVSGNVLPSSKLTSFYSLSSAESTFADSGLAGAPLNGSLNPVFAADSIAFQADAPFAACPGSTRFSGTSAIDLGPASPSKLPSAGNFTAMAWVKPSSTSGNRTILASGNSGQNGWKFGFTGNKLRFTANGVIDIDVPTDKFALSPNQWHHYAVSIIGDSGKRIVVFHVNGNEVHRAELSNIKASTAASMRIGSSALASGQAPSTLNEPFIGAIADLKVFSSPMDAAQISKVSRISPQNQLLRESDADADGLSAGFEADFGLDDSNPADAMTDADGDGLANLEEFLLGTNPRLARTWGVSDILSLGLASWLPLDGSPIDKASGGNAWIFDDEIGFPVYTTGFIKGALSLDGYARPHQVVKFSSKAPTATTTPDMAIALWVKTPNPSRNSANPVIIGDKDAQFARNAGFALGVTPQGKFYFNLGDGTNQAIWESSRPVASDAKWHHVAVVLKRRQSSTAVAEFFIDGVADGQIPLSSILYTPSGNSLVAGSDGKLGANWPAWFDGQLDDIRAYSRALSSSEIAQLANLDSDANGTPDRLQQSADSSGMQTASSPAINLKGASYSSASGNWYSSADNSVSLADRRGAIEYSISTPGNGLWILDLAGRAMGTLNESEHLILEISIDGKSLGFYGLFSLRQEGDIGSQGSVRLATPWLAKGNHTVKIRLVNVEARRSLQLDSLKLFAPAGQDLNANSTPDWVESLLASGNNYRQLPQNCLVSPVCLEGRSRNLARTSVTLDSSPLPLRDGVNQGWFANIPLAASGAPQSLAITFEDGSSTSQPVNWARTNLLDDALFPEPLTRLRLNDAIRLSAWLPDDAPSTLRQVSWQKPDGSSSQLTLDSSLALKLEFTAPGSHSFSITKPDGTTLTRSYQVVQGDFGPDLFVETITPRVWNLPAISRDFALDNDASTSLEDIEPIATGSRSLLVSALVPVSSNVLARTSENGPIVATGRVKGFAMANAVMTEDSKIVETRSDGSIVIKNSIVFEGELPPDFRAVISLVTAGVCFSDGSRTITVTSADLDASGVFNFLVEKAPGADTMAICHSVKLFSGNVEINAR